MDDAVPESSRSWVDGVMVRRIGDNIDLTAFAAEGILAEPDAAIGEALPVFGPVGIAFPAVVDWVSGETPALGIRCGGLQLSS